MSNSLNTPDRIATSPGPEALAGRKAVKVAWLTDIHLNFIKMPGIRDFCGKVREVGPDAVFLTGDIGEAPDVGAHLLTLERELHRPIYFVLGNHDFYKSTFAEVKEHIAGLVEDSRWLRWVSRDGVVELTPGTGLLGHEGWPDGRLGLAAGSPVMVSDFLLIGDLMGLPRGELFQRLNFLGDEAAQFFREKLPGALSRFQNLIVLCHVPPFREATWHEGKISNDDYLPHFSCKAVGEVLRDFMERHEDRTMTVLCGHTHGAGEAKILPNLLVKTGGARYGRPQIQEVFSVE